MLDLNQPQVGYEPTLIPDHTGVAEDIGIEPNTLTGTSRLAGGPYHHQGLSSIECGTTAVVGAPTQVTPLFVLITGLEPITSDVSGRGSNQLIYMSGFIMFSCISA